jgi:hypothetical protein
VIFPGDRDLTTSKNSNTECSTRTLRQYPIQTLVLTLALCLLALLAPERLRAQTATSVTGVVTDSSGAIIPGVTVVLSNPSTGVKFQVKTDSAGSYRLTNIPPGPGYNIEFTSEGFSPFQVNDIYVNVGSSRTQNAKLQPGISTSRCRSPIRQR